MQIAELQMTLKLINWHVLDGSRLDNQPLFEKMSPQSYPERVSLGVGSKTRPGRQRKKSL